MFNEEAFINKMVTSYLSSNKNKRVSNVQKASFGEIMKYIVTSMNLHITPDEAKNALKTGTLKNKNSGNMVAGYLFIVSIRCWPVFVTHGCTQATSRQGNVSGNYANGVPTWCLSSHILTCRPSSDGNMEE